MGINSVVPDQMLQNAASNQGLCCLPLSNSFWMYQQVAEQICYTLRTSMVRINPCPAEPRYTLPLQNSLDPDQLASSEAN